MSAELMKSKFVRRPSVHSSVASIISEATAWIAFKFQLWLPLGHMPRHFFHFWKKKFLDFLGILFVFVNMGPYGRQNFKTLLLPQISFESFQTFSEISSQWSSQEYCFGFLKFWVFDFSGILFVFVNMVPYGIQNFKTLLFPQITFDFFLTSPEFSSQWSSQKYCFGFFKL